MMGQKSRRKIKEDKLNSFYCDDLLFSQFDNLQIYSDKDVPNSIKDQIYFVINTGSDVSEDEKVPCKKGFKRAKEKSTDHPELKHTPLKSYLKDRLVIKSKKVGKIGKRNALAGSEPDFTKLDITEGSTFVSKKLYNDDFNVNFRPTGHHRVGYYPPPLKSVKLRSEKKLVVLRHGERMDTVFGTYWYKYFFDGDAFRRQDLNMPKKLPIRAGGPSEYFNDSPLTNIGHYQAFLTGQNMRDSGIKLTSVYCSCALRCVETASSFLRGYKAKLSICVEPGLFEYLQWYQRMPKFIKPSRLAMAGFQIDLSYRPVYTVSTLKSCISENAEEFYCRSHIVTTSLLSMNPGKGDVLLVGHASSLDVNTRMLLGRPPRSEKEILRVSGCCPFASAIVVEGSKDGSWSINENFLGQQSFTHQLNSTFNALNINDD